MFSLTELKDTERLTAAPHKFPSRIFLVGWRRVLQLLGMQEAVVGGVTPPHTGSTAASNQTPAVELVNVTKRFGGIHALDDLSVSIQRGEFFSVLGPSGCGKTTLLRIIAGLELPDSGALNLNGRNATRVPAHARPVNTVFQSYALFPHLTVRENVAFGLRMKRVSRRDLEARVRSALDLVQIADLASRKPGQVSGGQKQRVALARAIVNEPEVLLLDEPLGALDVKLRLELQAELRAIQRRLGTTFIYVTHDQTEALALSDRVAIMKAGWLEQIGAPEALYAAPRNRYVARFLGSCNLIDGTVEGVAADSFRVRTAFATLTVQPPRGRARPTVGQSCALAMRPEQVVLSRPGDSTLVNCFAARVRETTYAGAEMHYRLESRQQEFTAKALNTAGASGHFAVGSEVMVHLNPTALVLLED
jgi:spermidine/putrescine transport system ATP-binding protein